MAVFTPVTPTEVARFLEAFDLGTVASLDGIASGIENTNYFLETTGGDASLGRRFVLTIFEKLRADELPFYLEFMRALSAAGIRVPRPMPNRAG
ncbi:MAG TPA: phosphotransferase, partial [Burkholderiaceae bacterium]|nr:phosphotransferase [Burkholderiaceae bacterium]